MITAEKPAQGISVSCDYDDLKIFTATCQCTNRDHSQEIIVEKDNIVGLTSITICSTQTTKFWSMSRFKIIWNLLTKGTIRYESSLMLNEQQAINYASAILNAITEVKKS